TLLEDLPPQALASGAVLFHEHLSLHYPLTNALAARQGAPPPKNFSDDVDLMVAEARAAGKDGVSCIVDGGHPDMDRRLEALKRIAAESGVHIVASGGYYMQRNYPADIATKSVDQIADDLVRDARDKIAIGHVCCLDDPKAEIAKQVARRGAFVGFDRVT